MATATKTDDVKALLGDVDVKELIDQTRDEAKANADDARQDKAAENRPEAKRASAPKTNGGKCYLNGKEVDPEYYELVTSDEVKDYVTAMLQGKDLSEGTDTAGGHLVPTEFEAAILHKLRETPSLRNQVREYQMATNEREIAVENAAVTANWIAENASITTSDQSYNQVKLVAHKLAARTRASRELVDDAKTTPGVIDDIIRSMAGQMARAEDVAIISGTGDANNQPTGIDTGFKASPDYANTDTADTLNTFTAANVLSCYDSLPIPYLDGAIWVIPDLKAVKAALRGIAQSAGRYLLSTPGAVNNVVQPRQPGQIGVLFDKPVFATSALNKITYTSGGITASKAGVILFFNPNYYGRGNRAGIRTETTTVGGTAWEKDQVEVKSVSRVAGKVLLNEAYSILSFRGTA